MTLLKDFDWSLRSVAKIIGVVLLGALALSFVVVLVGVAFRTVVEPVTRMTFQDGYRSGAVEEAAYDMSSGKAILPIPPVPGEPTVADDAEDFEVREHRATYRTTAFAETCDAISSLKTRDDINFESADRGDESCSFTFNVEKAAADEVIATLRALDPENFNTNVFTIQQIIEDQTDELAIQTEKLQQLEAALRDARASYDELSELAKNSRDIEALTQLVDLKLNTINRLASEKLAASQDVDRITRARAEQLQRLEFETFYVNVYRVAYVDLDELQQSWQTEVKNLIATTNDVIQTLSIGLVAVLIRITQAVVYLLIAIGVARLVWAVGRRIWTFKK